jgi:hypothetical protein
MKRKIMKPNQQLIAVLAGLVFIPALAPAVTTITSLPYSITAPGVYELQSNLTVNGGLYAIDVLASDATINLNGFTITQTAVGKGSGVMTANAANNLTVLNGTISGFEYGLDLGPQCNVQDVQLFNNRYGVYFGGDNSQVTGCLIVGTGAAGNGVGVYGGGSGILVKDNQVSQFATGIISVSVSGSAFIHNYVASSTTGLRLSANDSYQGNVVTNCTTPFVGGINVGKENGGS